MGVPALLLWGGDDEFAPLAGGAPVRARDARGTELVVLEDAGHFVWEDAAGALLGRAKRFLGSLR